MAADVARAAVNRLIQQTDLPPPSNEKPTIVTALTSHFHDGATSAELRTFIKDVFDREIDRTSMSPRLTRLREDGVVEQKDNGSFRKVEPLTNVLVGLRSLFVSGLMRSPRARPTIL